MAKTVSFTVKDFSQQIERTQAEKFRNLLQGQMSVIQFRPSREGRKSIDKFPPVVNTTNGNWNEATVYVYLLMMLIHIFNVSYDEVQFAISSGGRFSV